MSGARAAEISRFLATTDWAHATRTPLAGDASRRRYSRLTGGPVPALLMDAPPDTGERLEPFIDVATFLRTANLSAPEVHAADTGAGLAVIEDLGEALYARAINKTPALEEPLYAAAADVLAHLHTCAPPAGLPRYDPARMGEQAALSLTWYASAAPDIGERLRETVASLARDLAGGMDRFTQRDYHAENLIWLPERTGLARVGLLDFQDAAMAPAPYDLVSLLSDARRDVGARVAHATRARYMASVGADPKTFTAAYHFCGAQRGLRILGVFARLWLRDGKPGYLHFLPRVWQQMQGHLADPALAGLNALVRRHMPAPSRAHISALRAGGEARQ